MSRVQQIVDNHKQLGELVALLKHHGLNAEYVCRALLEKCEEEMDEGKNREESAQLQPFVQDLKQMIARF